MYGVSFVPSPNRYRNDFGIEGEDGDLACAEAIEQEILAQGPESVAAVIAEPISLENNNHVPSARYWQRVREIRDRHGVLLIMDEVINGFGRTGTMFATEQFEVIPDLMTMAKGLSSSGYAPIAAVAVREQLYDEFKKRDVALAHLLTFGGQAVSCAAAPKKRSCPSAAPETADISSIGSSRSRAPDCWRRARPRPHVRGRAGQGQGDEGAVRLGAGGNCPSL
jgi:adenosylmethionine-8-amino-7-oxononanoate aminotransferase